MFRDQDWFENERLTMQGQWTAVCRSNDVSEPGSFVAVDALGEPVAIVRGRDQVLRAVSNVVGIAL
jgi:phenylpropionate dioxygenase-like ring-hydroxylating dioxygenase large terminal subunit